MDTKLDLMLGVVHSVLTAMSESYHSTKIDIEFNTFKSDDDSPYALHSGMVAANLVGAHAKSLEAAAKQINQIRANLRTSPRQM